MITLTSPSCSDQDDLCNNVYDLTHSEWLASGANWLIAKPAAILGLLLLGVASTPAVVILGYLLFSATSFTAGMLLISSWADVLPVRQLAVGGAAINTLWQVGNFLSPYAWGMAKDATGKPEAEFMYPA